MNRPEKPNKKLRSRSSFIAYPISALMSLALCGTVSANEYEQNSVADFYPSPSAANYATNQAAIDAADIPYEASLKKYMERHGEPRIEKLNDRVFVARAYDWTNITFVIGDDGIIAIDTGMHKEATARALADLRKVLNTDKEIVAVFYTHGHEDHVGGIRGLVPEGKEDTIAVYANSDWRFYQDNRIRPNHISDRMRAEKQYYLDRFKDKKDVASIFGPLPQSYAPTINYLEPSHEIPADAGIQQMTVSGVRMQINPLKGELVDYLVISLPDDKVVIVGDNVGDTFPWMFTPRLLGDRDPSAIIAADDYILSLNAHSMVIGHGNTIKNDPAAVKTKVKNFRDGIQTVVDQVVYFTNKGYSQEEVAERVRLPEHLLPEFDANHHHPMVWHAKQAYVRKSGWFSGNPRDMIKPLPTQEAKHMVELAGGAEQLLKKAQKSFDEGDNGWAVQQADYLLTVGEKTEEAKQIMIKAYRAQAAIAVSGMEYNYYVSEAKQLEGTYRYGGIIDFMPVRDAVRSSATDMVDAFSSRYDMAKGENEFLSVNIHVTDINETFGLRIDHGIFYRKPKAYADADATITLTKPELFALVAAFKTPEELNLNIKGDKDRAFEFFRILGL